MIDLDSDSYASYAYDGDIERYHLRSVAIIYKHPSLAVHELWLALLFGTDPK